MNIIHAQEIIEKHMDYSPKKSVVLNLQIADSITIRTWDKNELYVKASVNINENKDNAAYETTFNDTGTSLNVDAHFSDKYFKGKKNCCNEAEISWEVYVPQNAELSLETINGNVTITGQTKDVYIKSISGFIDMAVPGSKNANVDFSTISGTMYSNHDFSIEKDHRGIPSRISQKLNNGGDKIKLETISGDIFFRKSN